MLICNFLLLFGDFHVAQLKRSIAQIATLAQDRAAAQTKEKEKAAAHQQLKQIQQLLSVLADPNPAAGHRVPPVGHRDDAAAAVSDPESDADADLEPGAPALAAKPRIPDSKPAPGRRPLIAQAKR